MIKNRTDKTVTVDGKEVEFYVQKPTNEAIKPSNVLGYNVPNSQTDALVITKKDNDPNSAVPHWEREEEYFAANFPYTA